MGTYNKDYIDARVEEIELEKLAFLKIVIGLELWLTNAKLDRSTEDGGVFTPEYQTEDMKTEILHVLDNEIEALKDSL